MLIRTMRPEDMKSISELQPIDWEDIRFYFKFYMTYPIFHPVVVEYKDNIIAVGNATINKDVGWIGHVVVHPQYRNKGIGQSLLQNLIEILLVNGCNSIQLNANGMGKFLYKKLGFVDNGSSLIFKRNGIAKKNFESTGKISKVIDQSDMATIFQMDFVATGENRKALLTLINGSLWVYTNSCSEIKGFFIQNYRGNVIVAQDANAGIALLDLKASMIGSKITIPVENANAKNFLSNNGYNIVGTTSRMYLGTRIKCQGDMIYESSNGAWG